MTVLVFTGGEGPQTAALKNIFNMLEEKALLLNPYIIAADSGLEKLHELNEKQGMGLYPHEIIGDMDSIADKSLLELYKKADTSFYIQDKDYTDTELALIRAQEICGSKDCNNFIVLIGACGLRSDHFVSVMDAFSSDFHMDLWIGKQENIWYLKEGQRYLITNLKQKENISFMRPFSSYNKGSAVTEGLEWEGNLFRKCGMASISNRISSDNVEGKVYFTCQDGSFLAFLPQTAFAGPVN